MNRRLPVSSSSGNMDVPDVVPRLRGVLDDFGWGQGFFADLHTARKIAALPALTADFNVRTVEADFEFGKDFLNGGQ